MSRDRLEYELESSFKDFCRSLRVRCLKLRLASESAWPDRTLIYRGQFMVMELKRRGERPTPLQDYTLRELSEDGVYARWSNDLEQMKLIVIAWVQHVDQQIEKLRTLAG